MFWLQEPNQEKNMNRPLCAQFWQASNAIWFLPVKAKPFSKTANSRKPEMLWKPSKRNRNDMDVETDQKQQRQLLLMRKSKFCLIESCSEQAHRKLCWTQFGNNIILFGLRGYKEQRGLRWGGVVLKTDSEGIKYLEYFERQTRTRTGEDPRNLWPIKPRMYANKAAMSSNRCPLHVFKV